MESARTYTSVSMRGYSSQGSMIAFPAMLQKASDADPKHEVSKSGEESDDYLPANDAQNAKEDFDGRHREYDEQFLLFDGIKAEELLPVIVALDEQGIPFEGVKVMINENNAGWTVRRLFDATRKEHELGRRVIALQELVESCRGIDLSGAEPKARADFRKSLTEAVQLLKSKRYTIETVDKATENLSASTKGVRKLYN